MEITKNNKKPAEMDSIIGQRILRFRKQNGITQKSLGEVLGVTFQQIQKYEGGRSRISLRAVEQICNHYNVSPIIFFRNK